MRVRHVFFAALALIPVAVLAQSTNWAGGGEAGPVPDAWAAPVSPGWYFWTGAGFGFFLGCTSWTWRILRTLVDVGGGGSD